MEMSLGVSGCFGQRKDPPLEGSGKYREKLRECRLRACQGQAEAHLIGKEKRTVVGLGGREERRMGRSVWMNYGRTGSSSRQEPRTGAARASLGGSSRVRGGVDTGCTRAKKETHEMYNSLATASAAVERPSGD